MNDRIPGSSPYNPIKYRGWEISLCSCGGFDVMGASHRYCFAHESYDPTPLYSDDPPADDRCGHAPTVEKAKAEIDEYEDEHAEANAMAEALGAPGFGGANK